ncbi:MAG: ADP-ribose pyrophosphatase YjhB (NUDIX family) [Candidatus Marinamargulisbacteria bacterium]|jgi:ADP-ribose pyrophosphatase YjhB (NUDIX family)
MIKTSSAGGIVINPSNDILVVSQGGRTWSLPKGHLEDGETPLAAARREIEEETGVTDLTLIKSLGTYDRFKIGLDGLDDRSELKTIILFLFTTPQTILAPQDTDNPEARWVNPQDVSSLLSHPKDAAYTEEKIKELNLS